jgi:hypothetical protein
VVEADVVATGFGVAAPSDDLPLHAVMSDNAADERMKARVFCGVVSDT